MFFSFDELIFFLLEIGHGRWLLLPLCVANRKFKVIGYFQSKKLRKASNTAVRQFVLGGSFNEEVIVQEEMPRTKWTPRF